MATWPTSVAADAQLYIAVNELQTNLSSGINAAVTTITLNSTTSFPTVGLVLIDNEIIKYTGVSGSDLTGCTRGFDGTTAATHSSGGIVSFAICANHHNVLKDEIKAIEQYLSDNLGTGAAPLTASRALVSDASGKIIVASVTSTELGYLSGVTSAIQTQLGLLAPKASPAFTGTINTALTASRAIQTDASSNLQVSAVTTTELGYMSGVTSAVQTQLDSKPTMTVAQSTFTPTVTGFGTVSDNQGFYQRLGNMVHVWGSFKGGTATGVSAKMTLPVGSLVYTNRLPTNGSCFLGWFMLMFGSRAVNSANQSLVFADGSDTAAVYFTATAPATGSASWVKNNGSSFASDVYFSYDFWYATA